jgi:hypothetical protein
MDTISFGLAVIAMRRSTTLFHSRSAASAQEEHRSLDLKGLVFKAAETLDRQSGRAMGQLAQQPSDMARYDRLTAPRNQDESLFSCNPIGTRCPCLSGRGPCRAGSPD